MNLRTRVSSLWLAACFAALPVFATEQLSVNFTQITFTNVESSDQALPYDLVFTLNADGSVDGVLRPPRATDITLKRGVFYPAPMPQTTLELTYEDRAPSGGGYGILLIDTSHSAAGGGGHVRVFDGVSAQQTASHNVGFRVDSVDLGDGLELRVTASASAQLSGSPSALFNRPAPGQPLVARIPIPARGATATLTLRIDDGTQGGTLIPIKIKHNA